MRLVGVARPDAPARDHARDLSDRQDPGDEQGSLRQFPVVARPSWMARWLMPFVVAAPCQCSTLHRDPDHVAGPDLALLAAALLNPADAGGDDQRPVRRMTLPGRPCARLDPGAASFDVYHVS